MDDVVDAACGEDAARTINRARGEGVAECACDLDHLEHHHILAEDRCRTGGAQPGDGPEQPSGTSAGSPPSPMGVTRSLPTAAIADATLTLIRQLRSGRRGSLGPRPSANGHARLLSSARGWQSGRHLEVPGRPRLASAARPESAWRAMRTRRNTSRSWLAPTMSAGNADVEDRAAAALAQPERRLRRAEASVRVA